MRFILKKNRSSPKPKKKTKLGYKDQREFDALPSLIEELEREQADLCHQLTQPEKVQGGAAQFEAINLRLQEIDEILMAHYQRWEELDSLIEDSQ